MKLTEQTVSYGRKVQVKQFEPVEVYASRKFELDENDTEEEVAELLEAEYKLLRDSVEKLVLERIMESKMDSEKSE